jgi:hypothetical protein
MGPGGRMEIMTGIKRSKAQMVFAINAMTSTDLTAMTRKTVMTAMKSFSTIPPVSHGSTKKAASFMETVPCRALPVTR